MEHRLFSSIDVQNYEIGVAELPLQENRFAVSPWTSFLLRRPMKFASDCLRLHSSFHKQRAGLEGSIFSMELFCKVKEPFLRRCFENIIVWPHHPNEVFVRESPFLPTLPVFCRLAIPSHVLHSGLWLPFPSCFAFGFVATINLCISEVFFTKLLLVIEIRFDNS